MPTVTYPEAPPAEAIPNVRDAGSDASVACIPPFKVVFLNDDKTTMEFVVHVLRTVFGKDLDTAVRLMLEVHHTGATTVAILPKELAELRQLQTHSAARAAGFPLRCVIEPA